MGDLSVISLGFVGLKLSVKYLHLIYSTNYNLFIKIEMNNLRKWNTINWFKVTS